MSYSFFSYWQAPGKSDAAGSCVPFASEIESSAFTYDIVFRTGIFRGARRRWMRSITTLRRRDSRNQSPERERWVE